MDFEVLICGSDVNAYYMARCTHEAYNRNAYMLIKDKLAYTTYSKIINHIYNDKIWNEDDFVDAVNSFLDEHSDKKVLIVSSNETYARFLVNRKNDLRKNAIFSYPRLEILDNLINKEKFYKAYEKSCLVFPKTLYLNADSDTKDVEGMMYPIIVKPANVVLYNHVTFTGKKKIYKISDYKEFKDIFSRVYSTEYDDTLIVQEYIPGDDSHLFDSVVYCDSNGNTKLVSFAQIGLQEHNPNMVGNAAVLINGYNTFDVNTNKMVDDIKTFMDSIKYTGFAEFDLKYDERDGKFKVLEINARQGRCSYYISQAGYNLVKVMVDDLIYRKNIDYHFVDNKVMLSFVNKSIIRKYVENDKFREEALKMYKKSVNPIKYSKDFSIYRSLLYVKRDRLYTKSYADYKW